MTAWLYIMANRRFGTIYVGATVDLPRRAWEHRNDVVPSFTRQHQCHLLVYFEDHQDMHRAMQREHYQALATRLERRAHREGQSQLG